MTAVTSCPLCESAGGTVIARAPRWRLVRADEAAYFPAFYRVVWNDHVPEFSDLSGEERSECMDVVVAVETLIRQHLQPTKVNIASLGNAVPHVHWHVIARFDWDSHFPGAVWAAAQRPVDEQRIAGVLARRSALENDLGELGRPA